MIISIIFLLGLFLFFSDEDNLDYDYKGIVHDIKYTSNGYVFYLDYEDRSIFCYYNEKPDDLGYYSIYGNESSDGSIFFIDGMKKMDKLKMNDSLLSFDVRSSR